MATNGISLPELIGGLIGGGGLSQAAHLLTSRRKVRADTFKTVVDTLSDRLEKTESRLDTVESQHTECEQNLREVREDLDASKRASEQERQELKAEIARLMAGPVAGYKPRIP